MQKWGNKKAKDYFEANVPKDYRIPTEHSPVRDKEIWIRDKYDRKRFLPREDDTSNSRRTSSRKKKNDSDEESESDREAGIY